MLPGYKLHGLEIEHVDLGNSLLPLRACSSDSDIGKGLLMLRGTAELASRLVIFSQNHTTLLQLARLEFQEASQQYALRNIRHRNNSESSQETCLRSTYN